MIAALHGCPVSGIVESMPGSSTGMNIAPACSRATGVLSAGGENHGTVSSEGCSHVAVTVNEPCGSMVR